MKNLLIMAGLLAALAAVAAIFFFPSDEVRAEVGTLSGTVAYRERIALPPQAKVEVKLVDISLMDAPSKTIAETVIEPKGQVPVPFALSYDPALIQPQNTYALQARITVDGELVFITDQAYLVLTKGDGVTDLMLKRVAGDTSAPSAPGLVGSWLAEDIGGGGVIDNLQTTLTIAGDGAVNGLGGCNNFSGKATIDGAEIKFGPLAATRKACIPAVGDQETKFFAALSKVSAWRIDPMGKLELIDASSNRLVLMARQ